jgi:hypothetical protein
MRRPARFHPGSTMMALAVARLLIRAAPVVARQSSDQ